MGLYLEGSSEDALTMDGMDTQTESSLVGWNGHSERIQFSWMEWTLRQNIVSLIRFEVM